ncbi:MAG: isoleucine--tRNA ligase [Alphaproteobacteria bacterium]|nr:isoleucine--tRNA ligase [Alphaproteobacteria bacterium]
METIRKSMETAFIPYPSAASNPAFAKMEETTLAYWREHKTFEKSIVRRDGQKEFVFYDGPPFANGLPHYGHLVTGYVKDIVPRYQTMRGKKVERRFGWDCHGLPAELQTEKEIGVSGRMEVLKYGIDKYNAACRSSVLRFTEEWKRYVDRVGRWVDFENDYKTLDTSYMESVMWAFKQLWDKGLIYEDYRVVPYSWAVETPLSNFETKLDNSYRMRQDPAVTVAFKLAEPFEGKETYVLAWTTTPWTLPSNLALAVGAEIDYAVVEKDGKNYIIANERLEAYRGQLLFPEDDPDHPQESNPPQIRTVKGADLAGLSYEPLFPYFAHKAAEGAFQIFTADFVTTEDGTGTVHCAPFGEDDFFLFKEKGIEIIVPVDRKGCFTNEVPDFKGQHVFDANKGIIQKLKDRGQLVRHDTIDHNYPHCWRTDTPLIYMPIKSWYLQVTAFKDRMVELNQGINWIPGHIRDGQFGKWLENARDWNIARNRFWGAPIPVWRSDDPDYPRIDVYGSIEELERDFGVRVSDLHRPEIDNLTRPNPDDPTGKSTMRRVEDVLDCWFESGSMPYAQVHYPFENKDWFESHFPGDFIVEYIAQTRGWFYTIMVLSTALFDRAPFKNCLCHGVVLDEDHQKLSKRLRNYPDPLEVCNEYGSDTLRWYLVSTPLMQGGDLAIPREAKGIGAAQRQIVAPIWNAWSFYTLYANADRIRGKLIGSAEGVLDRYILSKTRELVESVQAKMDLYDLPGACADIRAFMDALNNWYIRRSRERFWRSGHDADKQAAYDTLYTVLSNLCRVVAPFLPFLTEEIYRGLTGEESVHLADWPDANALPEDHDLVAAMDRVRETCSAALGIRENERLRVRLPLAELVVAAEDADSLTPYADLIADELNVKQVTLSTDLAAYGTLELKINPQIGKRVGGAMKDIMPASKQGNWTDNGDGTVTVAGQILSLADNDYGMRLVTAEGTAAQPLSGQGAVILDTKVTPELEREGIARDLIRLIQQTRKDADFNVSDHIELSLELPDSAIEAIQEFEAMIRAETLSDSLTIGSVTDADYTGEHELLGERVKIGVKRV